MHIGSDITRTKYMPALQPHAMSRTTVRGEELTDTEHDMVAALDDTSEHVAHEFDPDDYVGMSTCGFASITNIDGRSSFVRRVKSLADTDLIDWVYQDQNGSYRIEIGSLELSLSHSDYHGCYRLSIVNTTELCHGANYQRMDAQERLHDLVLERLRSEWSLLEDAYRTSRID